MYLMDGLHVVVFILVLTQSASKGTLTGNCLKEMFANAGH
jgi:tetrahydromethanopterin S-methyltransferase subunit A